MKKMIVLAAVCGMGAAALAAGALEGEWKDFDSAMGSRKVRTATNVLARIERRASDLKAWPDLANALMFRAKIEYGITEENALDAERKAGFAAQYAERVERSPAEVRPMLRLALAHDYLSMHQELRWWRDDRTKLANPTNLPPWSDERLVPTLCALFDAIAADREALLAQKIGDWSRLLDAGDDFARRCRPTLWDFAVHDGVRFAGEAEGDRDAALTGKVLAWLDDLAARHSAGKEPDAHVDALYRKLQLGGGDKLSFAEKWLEVSAVSAEAAHAAAQVLSLSDKAGDRAKAHAVAERFAARWPESAGGRNCLKLAKELERPSFSLNVENQLLAHGEKVSVTTRNLSTLCFRLVPASFAESIDSELGRAIMGYGDKKSKAELRKICARRPTAEWSHALGGVRDFSDRESECPVPDGVPAGYYFLFAAPNDRFGEDGLPCECAIVSRTGLHLVYRNTAGGWAGFVNDAETGVPRRDAAVEFWRSQGDGTYRLFAKTSSAADGSWNLAEPQGGKLGFLRAHLGEDGTMPGMPYGHYTSPRAESPDRVHLVTDRAIYRPGQTVKFKGYAYHADPQARDFRVIANRRVFVEFRDTNDKRVSEIALVANDFGTFSGEFTAPRERLTGRYRLIARLRAEEGKTTVATCSETVNVEEYKRPKFTAAFKESEGLKLGEETKLTGVATTYTGLPVSGAKVAWEVRRETIRPYWWRWFCVRRIDDDDERPVASGVATTDEKGAFVCSFVPTAPKASADETETKYRFACSAKVTDASGEMHAAETSFTVGLVPWALSLSASGVSWLSAGADTECALSVATLGGKPVAGIGAELKAYSLCEPERPLRAKLWNRRGLWYVPNRDDAANPQTWANRELVASVRVKTDSEGRASGKLRLPAGIYRLEGTAETADGKTVRDLAIIRVIDPSAAAYAVREPFFSCLEKSGVKVGGTARIFFGSGYGSAHCRIRVKEGEEVLAEETREGTNWTYEFPVTAKHRGVLAFEMMFVRENRLYEERHAVFVPWDNLELKIAREHLTSRMLPDARETWRFRISGADTNDVRRGVEALAFMYDRSLDQLKCRPAFLPFDGCFSLPTYTTVWGRSNGEARFGKFTGEWPRIPDGDAVRWPAWLSDDFGVFGGVGSGWRGGTERMMRCEARGCRSRSMDSVPAVECCAMAECAAPAAKMCSVEAPPLGAVGRVRGGRVGAKAKEGKNGMEAESPRVVPRKNLAETAFFLPTLVSDEKGVVEFSFTVPQALTGWKLCMLAHDRNLANGRLVEEGIATVKPLMVEPNGPRFAREGDRFLFPVKVTNTDDKPQRGKVTLEFSDGEGGKPAAAVRSEGAPALAFDLKPGESKTFEFPVAIPDGCGCLKYVAKAAGSEFADGEEGFLPVLSRRVMVQESLPMQIRRSLARTFRFERLKESGRSDSLRHVGLTVQTVSDPTWYAFLALPYLMEYQHECNEQVFSRYYANALAAKIANADPAYRAMFEEWEKADADVLKSPLELNEDLKQVMLDATPWVREAADETRAKRHLGELFGSARLDSEQSRAIAKLSEGVGSDGLWPWFPGGHGSTWVTMHILTGFARLKALGVAGTMSDYLLRRTRRALDGEMEESIGSRLKCLKKEEFRLSSADIRWLYLQSFDKTWNKRYEKLLFEHLEREWTGFGIAEQSLAAIALFRHGDKPLAKEIVKSLKERAVRSEEKGLYWKRAPFFDCSLFGAPVCDQAVAMEAFIEIDPEDIGAYEDARTWLLEQKRTQNWSSTVSTVDAVYAILLGRGRTAPAAVGPVTVTLGAGEVPRLGAEAGTGFCEWRYPREKVTPAMGEITLSRKEDALGWASVTWTYLEDAAKVPAFEQKDLRLVKTYYRKTRVDGRVRLKELGGGEELRPGDELVSRLSIDSDRILEYVHLKDERPASAEPADVISGYRWRDGLGYYQSTRDTATHYYFDRLPRGNFVLETSFFVRQKGVFSSGLATAECMYAPEFGAHSSASLIRVGMEK